MPSYPPVFDAHRADTVGEVTGTESSGTRATGGSANTKGSYVELSAATPFASDWILVQVRITNSTSSSLIDVAIGAATSEIVILNNLLSCRGNDPRENGSFLFPCSIPSGVRLAHRVQSTDSSGICDVQVTLIGSGFANPGHLQKIVTYGATTADSGGISIDPGGSANTKGAYSEIASATTNTIKWVSIAAGNQNNTTRTACFWLRDIAIGSATSELIVVPDLGAACSNNDDDIYPRVVGLPLSIPLGVRVAERAQCSTTDGSDRTYDSCILGAG